MFDLEDEIGTWKRFLSRKGALSDGDIEEMESHLRDLVDDLQAGGLSPEESFLVAVRRIGATDDVSREFAKVNTGRLWKQLVLRREDDANRPGKGPAGLREDIVIVVALCVAAGTLAKIPEMLGIHLFHGGQLHYLRNASLFVLPMLLVWFVRSRELSDRVTLALAAPLAIAAVAVNLYPIREPGHTALLTGIHLPIALWLIIGVAYTGAMWGEPGRRMDFVRFSGEAFIYATLIALGGTVFVGFTVALFFTIGVDATWAAREWAFVYGCASTPIVAAYLVEAKRSVIENIAPVLAKVFAPFFLATMVAVLASMAWVGHGPLENRDYLIAFDLMLALVLGLILYIVSARDPDATPGWFDALSLALIAAASTLDAVALWAIVSRISSFGPTPNRIAALGENLLLLANLVTLAVLFVRMYTRRGTFHDLVRIQTAYLPAYAAWGAVVALALPPMFGYR